MSKYFFLGHCILPKSILSKKRLLIHTAKRTTELQIHPKRQRIQLHSIIGHALCEWQSLFPPPERDAAVYTQPDTTSERIRPVRCSNTNISLLKSAVVGLWSMKAAKHTHLVFKESMKDEWRQLEPGLGTTLWISPLFPSGRLRPTALLNLLRTKHFNSHLSLAQVHYVIHSQAHPG